MYQDPACEALLILSIEIKALIFRWNLDSDSDSEMFWRSSKEEEEEEEKETLFKQ